MSLAGGHSGLFSFDGQPRNDKVTKICITINNCKQAVNEVKSANIIRLSEVDKQAKNSSVFAATILSKSAAVTNFSNELLGV